MEYFKELKKIGHNLSILYAEDDEVVAQTTEMVLSSIFGKVKLVMNGQDALKEFENHKYDLVITDLKMPVMDGYELSKRVKKIRKDIPIVIFSAYIEEKMKAKFEEMGIFYIKKPFRPDIFFKTLYEVCEGSDFD